MKKLTAMILVLGLLLAGCGNAAPQETTAATETAAPTTEATTAPTTEPAPVYTNPLNGQTLEEPYTGRLFASTISNIQKALPHVSVNEADILMEMFVNNSIIRCIALFSDISDVQAFGSVRSTRLMFNDIAQHYDAVLCHAAGSELVLGDLHQRGIDNINLDGWDARQAGASYRDQEYKRGHEHSLFGIGPEILNYAQSQGIATDVGQERDYGLRFAEDGTPAAGEDAGRITILFRYGSAKKETVMVYDAASGKYEFWQYGKLMTDQITGEAETFQNVVIMNTSITTNTIYHTADFVAGGDGWYACGGKLIPITWTCESETSPFRFFTAQGEPLLMGVGNTYIAVVPNGSDIAWEGAELEDSAKETAPRE